MKEEIQKLYFLFVQVRVHEIKVEIKMFILSPSEVAFDDSSHFIATVTLL